MKRKLFRQWLLFIVITAQVVTGSLASAAAPMADVTNMTDMADMIGCELGAMAKHSDGATSEHDQQHATMMQSLTPSAALVQDTNDEHNCDSVCCCPSVCSHAVAILPQLLTLFNANTSTQINFYLPHPADLSIGNHFRPPVIA